MLVEKDKRQVIQFLGTFSENNARNSRPREDSVMPQTVEALYHDGIVELKQKPLGIRRAKALVVFLDAEELPERRAVDLSQVQRRKSSVDRWIGVIEGAELGDWKAERRTALEGKPR